MSTRRESPDVGDLARCAVCGTAEWTAEWAGHDRIRICRDCAAHVLPALIADATADPVPSPGAAERVAEEVLGAYWHGVAHAALRAARRRPA